MKEFYESVVKYDTLSETGEPVKVNQQFLIDAMSCTEAEAITVREVQPFAKGEIKVTAVKLSKYSEFIPENEDISVVDSEAQRLLQQNSNASNSADKYFAVKLSYIETNDKGKPKKTPYHYIVHATSVNAANDTTVQFMKGSMADWEINNIVETKIVDVVLHSEQIDAQ